MTPVYAYATVERGRSCWLLAVPRCPFCAMPHSHGGGPLTGDPRQYLGSRVAHCLHPTRFMDMYQLTDDSALQGLPVPEREVA